MTQPQQEYIDYLHRMICNTNLTIEQAGNLVQSRLVGKGYGCSEMEMEEAVKAAEMEGTE